MKTKTRILIGLAVLALFDVIIPVPLTAFLLIYVLYQKPRWFSDLVEKTYRGS